MLLVRKKRLRAKPAQTLDDLVCLAVMTVSYELIAALLGVGMWQSAAGGHAASASILTLLSLFVALFGGWVIAAGVAPTYRAYPAPLKRDLWLFLGRLLFNAAALTGSIWGFWRSFHSHSDPAALGGQMLFMAGMWACLWQIFPLPSEWRRLRLRAE